MSAIPKSFKVKPSQMVVLIDNVMNCPDADNDAERTVDELLEDLDNYRGWVNRSVLESALYCCNMNNEAGVFKHPQGLNFEPFVRDLLPHDLKLDMYYNVITWNR